MTASAEVFTQTADLPALLQAAAAGDEDAFGAFVDATMETVFRLEVTRALRTLPCKRARLVAEATTRDRYLEAWSRAGEHATSGLSPLAWLLTLHPTDILDPTEDLVA